MRHHLRGIESDFTDEDIFMEEIFHQFGRLILETAQHHAAFFIENHHPQHKKILSLKHHLRRRFSLAWPRWDNGGIWTNAVDFILIEKTLLQIAFPALALQCGLLVRIIQHHNPVQDPSPSSPGRGKHLPTSIKGIILLQSLLDVLKPLQVIGSDVSLKLSRDEQVHDHHHHSDDQNHVEHHHPEEFPAQSDFHFKTL